VVQVKLYPKQQIALTYTHIIIVVVIIIIISPSSSSSSPSGGRSWAAVDGDRVVYRWLRAGRRDIGGHGHGWLATVIDDGTKSSRAC
jgi:hypothetical protein